MEICKTEKYERWFLEPHIYEKPNFYCIMSIIQDVWSLIISITKLYSKMYNKLYCNF